MEVNNKIKNISILLVKNYWPEIFVWGVIVLAVVMAIFPEISLAGTGGTEFTTAENKVTEMIGGGLGRLIAVTSLAFALIASVLKFNPIAIAGSLGIGLTAGIGSAAVTAGVSALI